MLMLISGARSACWSFNIVEPQTESVFHPGDKVTIRANAGPNENIKMVFLGALKMNKSTLLYSAPFEYSFNIDQDFTGSNTILASARSADGRVIESRASIRVILPTSIVLKGIRIDPLRILLQKLPEGSDQNKVRAYEVRNIGVAGLYSDGVERELTVSVGVIF